MVYAHITKDLAHAETCDLTHGACDVGCRWADFHEWLAAPILTSDHDDRAHREERYQELIRGHIPAA